MKMKQLFITLFLLASYSLFSQGFSYPTQFNTVCEDDNNGLESFNLNLISTEILTNVTPSNYQISYHLSLANANSNINPLPDNYTNVTNPQNIVARVKNLLTNAINNMNITLRVKSTEAQTFLTEIIQCDVDQNGFVSFDFTSSLSSINTNNPLTVYANYADAIAGINPISNTNSYTVPVSPNDINIYVRETIIGQCDKLYFITIKPYENCDVFSGCNQAETLCNSFGVPFQNTTGSPGDLSIGCLNTIPNPKWFYLPINTSGTINIQVSQLSTSGTQLDVDYILFGPFTDPITPCASPNELFNQVASCSYSAAPVENFSINNALAGENYLLLVTNYSNQQGTITISETSNTQGTLNCTGIRMNAFLDLNNNGTQEISENNFPLGEFEYEMDNNGIINTIVSPSGFYSFYNQNASNTYDLSYSVNPNYANMYSVNPSAYTNVALVAGSGTQTYNFPVTILQNYTDLSVVLVPVNQPVPGFVWTNKIILTNNGNQIANGTITFTKDPNVVITTVSQSGTVVTTNGFTYSFSNLGLFESRTFFVSMQVPTPPTVNAGNLFTNSVTIEPFTDEIAENNTSSLTQEVVNSYDPNDKVESHGGQILYNSFTSNDYLYYTIRFENNGTANAQNVLVTDVLDSRLDENTLMMVDATHFYTLDRIDGALNWRFNAINLPVSVPDTTIGKGQLTFKIKPKSGYAIGDIIPNNASIYFDFNAPITTNTFTTEFVAPLSNNVFLNNSFTVYPNPSKGIVNIQLSSKSDTLHAIEIVDVLGKKVLSQKGNRTQHQTIEVNAIQSGIYFVEITTDSNAKATKKLIIE